MIIIVDYMIWRQIYPGPCVGKGGNSWPVSHTQCYALMAMIFINGTGSPLMKLDQWFFTEVLQKELKCQSACCLTLIHDVVVIE